MRSTDESSISPKYTRPQANDVAGDIAMMADSELCVLVRFLVFARRQAAQQQMLRHAGHGHSRLASSPERDGADS